MDREKYPYEIPLDGRWVSVGPSASAPRGHGARPGIPLVEAGAGHSEISAGLGTLLLSASTREVARDSLWIARIDRREDDGVPRPSKFQKSA